jgi:AraC-like DNA-binding protein
MASSRVLSFTDSYPYQRAIRAADVELFVTGQGDFRAELTQIDLQELWMQRGCETLPRILHSSLSASRAAIVFLADPAQSPIRHSGLQVCPGDIVDDGLGARHHHVSSAPCSWAAMSLSPAHLAAAGGAILGCELTAPAATHVLRPAPHRMARLTALHQEAARLARSDPARLAHPQVARALERNLVHAMVHCLNPDQNGERRVGSPRHSSVIARLEELLAASHDRPLYLAEVCAATGVAERTLRVCCNEHLGMGPIHYLWLRRMHLAREALRRADAATATVAGIAADHGFWELGRFSVEYRKLFGETPSRSLRGPVSSSVRRKSFQHLEQRPFKSSKSAEIA